MKKIMEKYNKRFENLVIVLVRLIIYLNMKTYTILGDSEDYISVDAKEYLKVFIHERRMPLYPIMIDCFDYLAKKIGGGETV